MDYYYVISQLYIELFLIKQCHRYHKYRECFELCQKLTGCNEADIYRSKSLYHLYTQEQILVADLPPNSIPVQELRDKRAAYSAMAREVIGCLLKTLHREEAVFDGKCSEMLDLAMIDYAYETNKLFDAKHCLLCREYRGCYKEDGGGVALKEAKNATRQQYGLKASHLFPESIIKRFVSAVPSVKGKKVCSINGFKADLIEGKTLHSSGECKLYLFCHDCEEMFSASESWFAKCFFDKLYDVNNPSSTRTAQEVPYNHHLYRFCVSMVFRLLRYETMKCLNSADIYRVLSLCRNYLLSPNPESLPSKPEVHVLISHISEEEDDLGSINSFLAGTMTGLFGFVPLDANLKTLLDTTPAFAHFFVVHMGIFNILVRFKPAESEEINCRFRISERGGIYPVPSNNVRRKLIPAGVFSVFQQHAVKMDSRMLEGPSLTYDPIDHPDTSTAELFGILDAEGKDENTIINKKELAMLSPGHTREICFLPLGFEASPPLKVPTNHFILLHHTHGGQTEGTIIFICIGLEEGEGYGVDKPYIILYNYKPSFLISTGFFVSIDDLKPVNILPKSRGVGTVKNPDELVKDLKKKDFSSAVMCTLREKGFYSLRSLICRIKPAWYVVY